MKELIKYKGFQVAPAELEGILLEPPSVEDAAVVGLTDKEAGEIPGANVIMSKNATENEEDIMKYVANNVAQYKKIRVLHFVDNRPKSHPLARSSEGLLKRGCWRKLTNLLNNKLSIKYNLPMQE